MQLNEKGLCHGVCVSMNCTTAVCSIRETLIKAFTSPDLRCEAAFSLANPCDPPEVAKEMLI